MEFWLWFLHTLRIVNMVAFMDEMAQMGLRVDFPLVPFP